jgi:hypothetical protein
MATEAPNGTSIRTNLLSINLSPNDGTSCGSGAAGVGGSSREIACITLARKLAGGSWSSTRPRQFGGGRLEQVHDVAAPVTAIEVVLNTKFFLQVQSVKGERLQHVFRMSGVVGPVGTIILVIRSHRFPIRCAASASPSALWS